MLDSFAFLHDKVLVKLALFILAGLVGQHTITITSIHIRITHLVSCLAAHVLCQNRKVDPAFTVTYPHRDHIWTLGYQSLQHPVPWTGFLDQIYGVVRADHAKK